MSDGWVKLKDPGTGKEFYANKFTRQTQWDAPPGFVSPNEVQAQTSLASASSSGNGSTSTTNSRSNGNGNSNDPDLPSNWERMRDEASGKYFYVDHVNKKTSWEHPGKNANANGNQAQNQNHSASGSYNGSVSNSTSGNSKQTGGTATGFGFIPASASASASSKPAYGQSNQTQKPSIPKPSSSNTWGMSHPPPSTSGHSSKPSPYEYKVSPSAHHTVDDQSTKYYQGSSSSSLPQIDFKVVKVPDRLRPSCPSCDFIFSIPLKRRHHCRLCGDVFCDACSGNRVLLPLSGPEFEKPVRVCNDCHVDVERGNYFSMRRYLTPLQLYDGENGEQLRQAFGRTSSRVSFDDDGSDAGAGAAGNESIRASNVAAALTSLSQDLDSVLLDSTSFSEKVTIPADILVPAISRHLALEETSDRAIRALSNLLALGNVVGDNSFVSAVYLQEDASTVFDNILNLLEWSGTNVKTLAVQEQAARAIYYLTDARVVSDILSMEEASGRLQQEGWRNSAVMLFDVPRVLRSMLDHTTNSASPTLQRWAAACIRNLIGEDQRRACEAVSEAMTMGMSELSYQSIMTELVSTGGVMILSSLVSNDDADTRAHAMAALSQIIEASRELNVRLGVFIEAYQVQNIQTCSETAIVEAIVSSGACGPALAQLLLSADNASASMACDFARSLVYPIISDPLGSSVPRYHRLFSSANLSDDNDGLSVYRKAALDIGACDGVLSALVNLVNDSFSGMGATRPVELRRSAMEILAAVSLTLSFWESKFKNCGRPIESMADDNILRLQEKVGIALATLEEEHAAEVVLAAFSSTSINSLNTSRDSPNSQLKEAAALIMCALSSCSTQMANLLVSSHVLTSLIAISSDDGFNTASSRGTWSSRRLPMLEAVASILVQGWKSMQREGTDRMLVGERGQHVSTRGSSSSLELLLEALDAGLVPLISRILNSSQEFTASERAYADTRTRIAICHCVSAMFGIGRGDTTSIGFARIFEAMGNNHRVIPQILYLLGSIAPEVQNNAAQGRSTDRDIPLLQLLEANLLAAGSICGSEFCSFGSMDVHGDYAVSPGLGAKEKDVFSIQFQEICLSACEIISKNSFLPSALVGAFGEGAVMPTLRLVSAIAENGSTQRVHQQLVRSGVLLPVTDMLRDAMNAGDYYIFDACVATIGHAGPHMNSSSENNSIRALRDCVKLFSNVLAIEERNDASSQKLVGLKKKCITAVELLSTNSSLWTVIVAHFIPMFSEHWLTSNMFDDIDAENDKLICAGLQTILRVISLPTHAVFIANTGIAATLSNIICGQHNSTDSSDGNIEGLSIQILHSLLSHCGQGKPPAERIEPGVVDVYALDVACVILSRDIHIDANTAMLNTKLGLDILLSVLSGLDEIGQADLPQSPRIIGFVETVSSNRVFLRRLCATVLCTENTNTVSSKAVCAVEPLYGSPLLLFEGTCGPFMKSADAALHILFWIAFYSSVAHSQSAGVLWDVFMLDDEDISDQSSKYMTTSASSANFLNILCDDQTGACLPTNKARLQYYQRIALPVVRERLLHVLSIGSAGYASQSEGNVEYMISFQKLLGHYRVPQLCLELTRNPELMEPSFEALENALVGFPSNLLGSIVSERSSLVSLFNLLSVAQSSQAIGKQGIGKIRVFSAAILSSAGELSILGPAVNRLGLRSVAVASLSAACLMEDQYGDACLAEDMTEEGSSMSTLCLHGLVDVLSTESSKDGEAQLMISPSEAQAISSSLGKKLSSMVLERFMHKAERDHVLGGTPGDEAIRKFPEVTLLCALASSKEALTQLCANGGLEALSLVAAEGELSAINALNEACQVDPTMIIDVDGHISALHVIGEPSSSPAAKKGCFDLLTTICTKSRTGRLAIGDSDECSGCIEFASGCIKSLSGQYMTNDGEATEAETTKSNIAPAGKTQFDMELAAISFISCLVNNERCRGTILKDVDLESAIEILAKDAQSYEIQHAAILYLGSCARYVRQFNEETNYSVENISSALLSIINSSQSRRKSRQVGTSSGLASFGDFSKSHQFNENLILASACRVIECLLPHMPQELVSKALITLATIWSDTVTFQMLALKKTASQTRNSGILMFNISSILLLASGSSETQDFMMSSGIVSNLLRLILSNPTQTESRSKQSEPDVATARDTLHWQGALTQSLQSIATLTVDPSLQTDDGDSWEDLISKLESEVNASKNVRRPFGMPRQVSSSEDSIKSSLENIVRNVSDPTSTIAATRIMENLFG